MEETWEHVSVQWRQGKFQLTFGEYSAVSGLKINFDKSEFLKIGSARKNDDFIETNPSLHWAKKPLNVLGILVTPELQKVVNMNITPVVQKLSI